jgi:hypothetical protein
MWRNSRDFCTAESAAYGATPSLSRVSTKAPFTIPLRTLRTVYCLYCQPVGFLSSRPTPPGRPPAGKLDGCEGHEGGQDFGKVLGILGETPVLSEPGEGALDHPAARQDDEAPFPATRNRESHYGRNATHFWVTLLASKPAASCLNDATRGQIGQILPYRPLRARARTPAIRPISGHPSNPSIRVSECRLCTLSLLHRRGPGSNAVVQSWALYIVESDWSPSVISSLVPAQNVTAGIKPTKKMGSAPATPCPFRRPPIEDPSAPS